MAFMIKLSFVFTVSGVTEPDNTGCIIHCEVEVGCILIPALSVAVRIIYRFHQECLELSKKDSIR